MKTKHFILLGLIALIFIGIVFLKIKSSENKNRFDININRTAVVKEMRELSRLETATFTIEKIIDAGTRGNKLQNLLFGDRLLLIAHGQVIAGFDLSTLSEKNISIEGNNLHVRLPAPQILVATLDNSQTRVYDRRQGILTLGEKDLESEARQSAQISIRLAACEAGILEQAATNGRKQLTAFFGALGFAQITLDIPTAECK